MIDVIIVCSQLYIEKKKKMSQELQRQKEKEKENNSTRADNIDDDADEVASMFDLKKKKRTKNKTTKQNSCSLTPQVFSDTDTWHPHHSYSHLLTRVMALVEQSNPHNTARQRITLKPPKIVRSECYNSQSYSH
jgi:hypothetical protein